MFAHDSDTKMYRGIDKVLNRWLLQSDIDNNLIAWSATGICDLNAKWWLWPKLMIHQIILWAYLMEMCDSESKVLSFVQIHGRQVLEGIKLY